MDDALVDTVTTDKNGRVSWLWRMAATMQKRSHRTNRSGWMIRPHYFEIKDGKRVTLQVTNKKLSGIVIHKIDSATGEGSMA